jgi:hypothetical protein
VDHVPAVDLAVENIEAAIGRAAIGLRVKADRAAAIGLEAIGLLGAARVKAAGGANIAVESTVENTAAGIAVPAAGGRLTASTTSTSRS